MKLQKKRLTMLTACFIVIVAGMEIAIGYGTGHLWWVAFGVILAIVGFAANPYKGQNLQ